MPRKPDYTKHQKQIQGKRLQSIMKEKGIRASEIVAYIEEHGEDADYTDRFPKYELAEIMGIHDFSLSRKLRHELSDEEQRKIVSLIEKHTAEKGAANV